MANSDGSVEIRITGSVDPSVAASANEAKAAMGGLSAGFDASAKSMAAAMAATGGNLKAITPEMLGLAAAKQADAVATAQDTAATVVDTAARAANTTATVNSRAAYESLVLVHEALQGRFTRMAGSSMILTQQLAGQANVAKAVAFATSAEGAAILGTVAVIGLAVLAHAKYEEAQKRLIATSIGLGAQSGLTSDQLEAAGRAAAEWSGQSISESTKAAEAFAAAGVKSEDAIKQLAGSVQTYADLTGVKFAKAQETLAKAMEEPVRGAKELHDQLGILNGDQIEQIQRLTELGDKEKALAILMGALKEREDEANRAGVGSIGIWGQMVNSLSNLWGWIGKVNIGLSIMDSLLPGSGLAFGVLDQKARGAAAATERLAQAQAHLNELSGKGAAAFNSTPEGEAIAKKTELIGKLHDAQNALAADTRLVQQGRESADVLARDRQAIEDYTHAVNTYMTPVQKKIAADKLDVEIAEARHKHNKQLVADLTEQKALLEEAGKVESDADAKALAAGKGDVAGARTGSGRTKKAADDQVAIWEEALHQQEVDSNNFFADETESELKFWQSKLDLVKKGSKDWRDIQSKIYDAEKTLAHKAYDEKLADLNDGLEADRNNFKKFQSDWEAKLAFIKSKFTEESTEYKDAHRQMESEMRQHEDAMIQAELSGQSKSIAALKAHLSAMNQLRQTDAKIQEDLVKEQSDGTILGEVQAAARLGDIHHQLAQDEIADATAVFNAEDTLRQQGLAKALAAWGKDDERYKNALKDELDATKAFYDQIALLQAKSSEQQIADIIAVENAYSGYVSGTVSATVSGLDGIVSKTKTWQQAVIGVYQSLVTTVEQQLDKMATKWVVEHVFMTSAQRAQLAAQNAAHAASEAAKTASTTAGTATRTAVDTAATAKTTALETTSTAVHATAETAKTGATTAGATTRAAVENSGFFAKLLSLLGISVATHTGAEAEKTGATTAGAATRAAAEDAANAAAAATQIATNIGLVTSYAGVAGAAGTASFAAAPWPIDMGAPAFGASMAAAAAAYESMAALDTGTNYLPHDMVAQIHEGERIIPKADNRQLMQVLAMGAGEGGRSDVHLHYGPHIHERERLDLKSLLATGGGDLLSFINRAVRDGKLKLKPA
jgi:hypothetical protein